MSLKAWHDGVPQWLAKEGCGDILNDPTRIWNMDETATPFDGASGRAMRVVVKKGTRAVNKRATGTKEGLTVTLTASASGVILPAFVISKGKTPVPKPTSIAMEAYPKASFINTESGWMTHDAFLRYLHMFDHELKRMKVEKPVVLFLDGVRSHNNPDANAWAARNGIHLMQFVPNSTFIMQPLDLAVCYPFRQAYNRALDDYFTKNGTYITKYSSPIAIKSAMDAITATDAARSGFRKAGLYPWDFQALDMARLVTVPQEEEQPEERVVTDLTIPATPKLPPATPEVDAATPVAGPSTPNLPPMRFDFVNGKMLFTPLFRKKTTYVGGRKKSTVSRTWKKKKNEKKKKKKKKFLRGISPQVSFFNVPPEDDPIG